MPGDLSASGFATKIFNQRGCREKTGSASRTNFDGTMKNTLCLLLTGCLIWANSCKSGGQTNTDTPAPVSSGVAKLENRFSDGVIGTHDPALLNDLLSEDFVSHHFPAPGNNNKAAFKAGMEGLFAGFPDIKVTRLQQYEEGDKVFTYAFWEANHTGLLWEYRPPGKKFTLNTWTSGAPKTAKSVKTG